jgi:hypothetical protein
MGRTVRRKCKTITGQEKNSYCPSGAEKGELFQGVLILSTMYLSKKKSESRSKRKDKAARSLDEHIVPLLKRRVSSSSTINKTRDSRMKSLKSREFSFLSFFHYFFSSA